MSLSVKPAFNPLLGRKIRRVRLRKRVVDGSPARAFGAPGPPGIRPGGPPPQGFLSRHSSKFGLFSSSIGTGKFTSIP